MNNAAFCWAGNRPLLPSGVPIFQSCAHIDLFYILESLYTLEALHYRAPMFQSFYILKSSYSGVLLYSIVLLFWIPQMLESLFSSPFYSRVSSVPLFYDHAILESQYHSHFIFNLNTCEEGQQEVLENIQWTADGTEAQRGSADCCQSLNVPCDGWSFHWDARWRTGK